MREARMTAILWVAWIAIIILMGILAAGCGDPG